MNDKHRRNIKTVIPITLPTDFSHRNDQPLEESRDRLQYIGFYTQALFRMIKKSVESLGDFDDKEIQWTLFDITHVCDIGVSIADAIDEALPNSDDEPEAAELNEIEQPIEKVEAACVVPMPEVLTVVDSEQNGLSARKAAEVSSLALQLSAVLNNQNLPIEIYNSVMESVAVIYNKGDRDTLESFESSPEYLKALLLAYAKREVSN